MADDSKQTNNVDTSVILSGIKLKNPIIPASGVFGFGREFSELYDLDILGAISFKGTTKAKRLGNKQPRVADCPAGMLNAVGLQNPGVDAVVASEIPELTKRFAGPLIANISGFSVEEFGEVAKTLEACDDVSIFEVNVSCPNVHEGGKNFGSSIEGIELVTREVRRNTKKPIYVKLSPNVTDIAEMAQAAEAAGADGISMINTVLGMRVDIKRRQPVLANRFGGYSGPGILPIALRMIAEVHDAVKLPIIGMGGIEKTDDVIEMIMAGATAVEVGAANLVDPWTCKKIIEELPLRMKGLGIERLSDICGIC